MIDTSDVQWQTGEIEMPIDPQKMTTSDVGELIDYYCIDCCHSCDECLLQDFNRELDFTIEEYNRKQHG